MGRVRVFKWTAINIRERSTKSTDVHLTKLLGLCRTMASESHQRGKGLLPICPGEIREENDLEKQAPAKGNETVTCRVWNDMRVAAEVDDGNGWQIIYSEAQLKMAVNSMDLHPELSVRLRDDPNVCGKCRAVQASTLQLSSSFGDFGDQAAKHVQKEEAGAEEESRLRKQRQKEIDQKLGAEVTQAVLRKQKWVMISFVFSELMVLAAMVFCAVAAFNVATELQGVGFAVGLLLLCACAGCGVGGLAAASGGGEFGEGLRDSVQAARPELQRYQEEGVDGEEECDWRTLTFYSCVSCVPLVFACCAVAMTVAFDQNGGGLLSTVLWIPVAVLICGGAVWGWRVKDGTRRERAANALGGALFFPFFWPGVLLGGTWLWQRPHGAHPETTQKVAGRGRPHNPRIHHCIWGQRAAKARDRVLVAWEVRYRMGHVGGWQPTRRHECSCGVSAGRVGTLWVSWSNSCKAGLAGLAWRVLVHSALWRTEAMGLQVAVQMDCQHRAGSFTRVHPCGILLWRHERPAKSKAIPLPGRNTCAGKPFSGARMTSSSLRVSKMPLRPV